MSFGSRFVIPLVVLGVSGQAAAQITADHIYNGIGRPLWVYVRAPKAAKGPIEIQLLEAVTATQIANAAVPATALERGKPTAEPNNRINLIKLFPDLWTRKEPQVLYAQLTIRGKKVGPALVLQPMVNPSVSRLKADGKTVEFVPDEDGATYNGIRAYVDQDIVFETSLGTMRFRMRPDAAPNTVYTIMQLVKGGLYTDTIFHRVVAKRKDGTPFVIQGGDPTGTGNGGPGFSYPLEDSSLPHDFGVLSIARSTDPNTNGGQVFVCLSREGTKHLDHKYAAFAQAISGAETILQIAAVPVGAEDRPTKPPRILRARLMLAMPYGEGPTPVVRPASETGEGPKPNPPLR